MSKTTSAKEETHVAGTMSVYVCTLMLAGLDATNSRPLIVIINAPALMLVLDIVIAKAEEDVGSHVAMSPLTVLAPGFTVGLTDCTK